MNYYPESWARCSRNPDLFITRVLIVHEWSWDSSKQVGRGGFGRVYEATGPVERAVVAKVVPKADGATRELLLAQDVPTSPHIVPILHVEEEADSWVLYMPRADHSLRDVTAKSLTSPQTIAILLELADALAQMAPAVVHRDLKPDNVLMLDGKWAVCDFGIARYADAATSNDTRKFSFSAPYAAPEQWRYERSTSATDVYAFGVMAFELLSGRRPFEGTWEQLREQHLNSVPPQLPGNRKMAWIISECLQKAPEARPTAANLRLRLARAGEEAATRGGSSLAAAQTRVLAARATEQTAAEAARTERERRAALFQSASAGYQAIADQLVEFIVDAAPATAIARTTELRLSLGEARLSLGRLTEVGSSTSPYDVIAFGSIRLEGGGRSRSHSLYYADFLAPRSYQWFELGFMGTFASADFNNEPRALPPGDGLNALRPMLGGVQLAYGIRELDPGDLDDFVDLWADRFGQAAAGRFPALSQLPDGPTVAPTRR